jgi:endonuclease-3
MLSAQCTDKRVNLVTRDLFQHCRTAQDYAAISQEELEGLVRSTGFYRNKAKNIRAMGAKLLAEHNGQVPDTLEALAVLPGVGRKTANVVLGNAFSKNGGVGWTPMSAACPSASSLRNSKTPCASSRT